MRDLSVIIPARNEAFLKQTMDNILQNIEADTEIIAVCDGYWPDPPITDHGRITIIHNTESIGQRAATNQGARLSQAKFVMKADAHCAFDKGFDRKLMDGCAYNWTLIPVMYNLHAFDWKCRACGYRSYQAPEPEKCMNCNKSKGHDMIEIWAPRRARVTYSWRFDKEMVFQYWHDHRRRPETRRGDYIETMSFVGACWFMHRNRYWELEGLDEKHGPWGQVGTEVACKTWLSGGKLLTAKKTWFAHFFRSQFGWPYKMTRGIVNRARAYSRDIWLNDKWPKAKYPLSWLVEKFRPVPDWHDGEQN